jgi:hypothetical protein
LVCASLPSCTSKSTSRTSSHRGKKLAPIIFPSYTSRKASRTTPSHCGGKLVRASFPFCTRKSTSRTTSSDHGGNLVLAFPLAKVGAHLEQHHPTVGES